MKHRIAALLLAVLLIASLLPGAASAADAGKVRVIVENTVLRENTITVSGHSVQIWYDQLLDVSVNYRAGMTAEGAMKDAFTQLGLGSLPQYEDGDLSGIGTLLEYGTGEWLVAVNDWITTLSERVQSGDTVRIQYTLSHGKDVGADRASVDKGLRALTFDCGALYPAFSEDVTSYTLYVPDAFSAVTVQPTAANRRLKVFVTAGNEDASRWGARSVSVSSGTVTVKVDGGRAYTVKLVPVPEPTPTPQNPFIDVPDGQYYTSPVLWAVSHEPQITNGTSPTAFSPDATCTRGQVVTFLWRAMGCPEPKSLKNPFTDVRADDYFYKPVLWASEKNITNGTSPTTFSPGSPCTRAHVVTFLWRAHEKPAAGKTNPFTDVESGQYYTDAVLWAVEKSITNGTSPTTFSPDRPCTRAQIVTFLWRDQTGGEKASALAAPAELDGALARLLEKTPAPKCGQDDLAVFDAARNAAAAGRQLPEAYYEYLTDVEAAAKATNGRLNAPDAKNLAGTVLAVTALGRNAASLGADLTARLNDRKFVTASGTEGVIWALLALDSGSYESYCRPDYLQAILAAQQADGSFEGDLTRTAMALQALAPYLNEDGVLTAVNAALRYLSEQQQPNGGYGAADPAAAAQALLACRTLSAQRVNLITAQIVPGFFEKAEGSPLTRLLTFREQDGGFPEPALRALIAEQCSDLGVMVYVIR